jgi:hypothetical protein
MPRYTRTRRQHRLQPHRFPPTIDQGIRLFAALMHLAELIAQGLGLM